MNLSITDPTILFPGISLFFLAYTNRYLALAGIVRTLNMYVNEQYDENREKQISSLRMSMQLIKYIQAASVTAFLFCVFSMLTLIWQQQIAGELLFVTSLAFMVISLLISLLEVMKSGHSLRIELDRTHNNKQS